uniref:Uncharacterized protein n=1 Tax=Anopheles dirus TaxID=7168 RepID=A0A182NWE5_9DIPT
MFTMLPLTASRCGRASLVRQNTDRRFVLSISSNCSTSASSIVPEHPFPALFTSTFNRPYFAIITFTSRSKSAWCVTSATTVSGSTLPSAAHSLRTSASLASLRAASTQVAPRFVRYLAVAAPIPELAPVMSTTLPVKSILTAIVS